MAKEEKKEEAKIRRPQAKKRDIQHEKRRLRNREFKSSIRTAIRAFDETLDKDDKALVKEKLHDVYSIMDKGVKRGVLKLNKASRTKARLAARAAAHA